MIRYPKKNIAQRSEDRQNQLPAKIVEVPDKGISEPQLPAPTEPESAQLAPPAPAPWAGTLYPSQLWHLHRDLELYVYQRHTLSPKERQELDERIPGSLRQAEQRADKLLYGFVQDHINRIGVESYYHLLEQATNDKIRILLALRCLMASTIQYEESTLVIFSNDSMNSRDFFPDNSYWTTETDPLTGEKIEVVQDKKGYTRSEEVQSKKHRERMRGIIGTPISDKDKMPKEMAEQMRNILVSYGIDPNIEPAILLDQQSKDATIEERILARIAYLVMNAVVRKKTYYLGG